MKEVCYQYKIFTVVKLKEKIYFILHLLILRIIQIIVHLSMKVKYLYLCVRIYIHIYVHIYNIRDCTF